MVPRSGAGVRVFGDHSAGEAALAHEELTMRTQRLMLVLVVALLAACASDREIENLTATLPFAATTGNARQLATCIEQTLDGAKDVQESDKADLRARAQILAAHADKLSTAIDLYDPAGKQNPSITLNNLRARADALEAEYRAAWREWGVWMVSHNLKKPNEIFEIFDYDEALR
jgi:hypothetical protein